MELIQSTFCLKKGKYYKLALLLFFTLEIFSGFSQNQKQRADSLYAIGNAGIKTGNFSEALNSFTNSLDIYKDIEDNRSIGKGYNRIATVYYYQGDFAKALNNFNQGLLYYEKAGFENGVSSSINNIGAIYYYLGNYSKALDYYKKAMLFYENHNNYSSLATTTQNIGNIYVELNDLDNAMKHYQTAKTIYDTIADQKAISKALNNIGEIHLKQNNYKKAIDNFESALSIAIINEEKQIQTEALFNLGRLFEKQQNYPKASEYYYQSLELSRIMNSAVSESSSLIAIGSVQLELNKKSEAINNFQKGLAIAEKSKVILIQKNAYEYLYKANKQLNRNKKALENYEKMQLLKDSLGLKQTANKILNMKYEKEMLMDSIANTEKERLIALKHKKEVEKKEKQRNIFLIAVCFALILALAIFSRLRHIKKSKSQLQLEKDRSEHLLLNILPEEIAEELKEKGYVDAQDFETASILFTDFKSFTVTASQLSPQELVEEINVCFKAFDGIMGTYNLEKIKTIGDAYMAAGGLPKPDTNAVKNMILAAIDMQKFIIERKINNDKQSKPAFEMRVGIHVGPIVAGIVGVKKFQYDVWGDTVNIASRMESNGAVGKVNISENTYLLVKEGNDLAFEYRGKLPVKGKGELEMYFVANKVDE